MSQRQLTFSADNKISLVDRKCLGIIQHNKQDKSHLLVTSDGNMKLQPSCRSRKRKNDENCTSGRSKRKDGIFEDPVPLSKKNKTFSSVSVQTDVTCSTTVITEAPLQSEKVFSTEDKVSSVSQADRTIDMLTSDIAPPEYWEGLAEKRREALEETLDENHRLHEENRTLRQEITELSKENKLLEEMVEQAKDLAVLVESLTGEEECSDHEDKTAKE
ncbi:uncharacterized protein geminin [Panulirus ornatus]|uniref:uncharacterized protein geminin n=1 Tax=Panulirus ornatus TaxID=150431 RepID=UPI003A859042